MRDYDLDYEIEMLPYGQQRNELIKKGWADAEKRDDYDGQFDYLYQLIQECCFHGDSLEIFVYFPKLVKLHDDYSKCNPVNNHTSSLLWAYKWLLENSIEFPQISERQFAALSSDFMNKCREYQYSLRSYYQFSFMFYKAIDPLKSEELYRLFTHSRRDRLSDCHACERSGEINYLLYCGKDELAVERAKDIFNGRLRCSEIPEAVYASFLSSFCSKMISGEEIDIQKAEDYCQGLRKGIERKQILEEKVGDVLMFYTLTSSAKALNYFKKTWYGFENGRNPLSKFEYSLAAFNFFNSIIGKKTYKMKLPNTFPLYEESSVYDIEKLKSYYYNIAKDLAAKFDARNGNDIFMSRLNQISNRNNAI